MVASQKRIPTLEMIMIIAFMAYYLLPALASSISFVVGLLLGSGYLAYVLTKIPAKDARVMLKYAAMILFVALCYFFLTQTKTIDPSVSFYHLKRFLSKVYQQFMMFLPVVFLYRTVGYASDRQKKALLFLGLLFFGWIMVNTTVELLKNPNAARAWSYFSEQSENNVGTYSFVCAVGAMVPVTMYCIIRVRRIVLKAVVLCLLSFLLVFLSKAQYTLALLSAIVTLLVVGYTHLQQRIFKVFALLAIPLILICIPLFLSYLAQHIASPEIALRLNELVVFFGSGDASGYNLAGRISLYTKTIQAFLSSPIIGNRSLNFDGHATFLTVLSDVGLLGAAPFYYLYFSMKNRVYEIVQGEKIKALFFPTFLCLIMIGFTNPIQGALPLALVVWFLTPLIINLLNGHEENKNE